MYIKSFEMVSGVEEVQDKFDGILKTAPWITGLFSTHDWNGEFSNSLV